jgi:quinol monooxygenase YgiN
MASLPVLFIGPLSTGPDIKLVERLVRGQRREQKSTPRNPRRRRTRFRRYIQSQRMAKMRSRRKPMTKYALYVPLKAKPGKENEVAEFLRSALPLVNAEPDTISWFAIQEGPGAFAIFDTFDDEAGRDAHLNGKVAAALMEKAKAGDLFAQPPEIFKLTILADKLPK